MGVKEIMTKEHHLIQDFISKVQIALENYGWDVKPSDEFFAKAIKFAEDYIETFHHSREEEVLFPALKATLKDVVDDALKVLANQHRQASIYLTEIRRLFNGFRENDPQKTKMFLLNFSSYISYLRVHLSRENHLIFLLLNKLSQIEEQEILQKFELLDDRLNRDFGKECKAISDMMTEILEKKHGDRFKYLIDSIPSKRKKVAA